MSILVDADTTFIVQGITGREAVNLTRECLDYGEGAKIVGGVTPGRKGREVHGVPVFDTVAQAVEHHGGPIDGSVVTVPPAFTKDAVLEAIANGVKLIVSVDTGIRAAEVVARANELGIDVIVTDHHLPEAALPPATAVLNPNRDDCPYPNKDLCGAGVAFKLAQALLNALDWPLGKARRIAESLLKIVAIATVADVVPLTGENRAMVKHGLDGLRDVRNPGLRAILDVAGFINGSVPSSRQVGFQIAPRLNAAGRMDTARTVIELFLTNDMERARELAKQLHDRNAERQIRTAPHPVAGSYLSCESGIWMSPLMCLIGPADDGMTSKSKISVGSHNVAQALGTSTTPEIWPWHGAVPRIE